MIEREDDGNKIKSVPLVCFSAVRISEVKLSTSGNILFSDWDRHTLGFPSGFYFGIAPIKREAWEDFCETLLSFGNGGSQKCVVGSLYL